MHAREQTADDARWAASWTQAVTDVAGAGVAASDTTIRITVPGTLDGTHVRLHLSNQFGVEPLTIGRAAVRTQGDAQPVLFAGQPSAVIPAGGRLASDAVAAAVVAGADIDVDLYLPGAQALGSGNLSISRWNPSERGDHCGAQDFPAQETPGMPHPLGGTLPAPTPLLSGVDVRVTRDVPVVVCLGDSITAAGWPERAAQRLRERSVAVVNRGIAGNRLRFAGAGPMGGFFGRAGRDRFDADVLDTAGRTHVVIALGTNDLGHPGQIAPESELPTLGELIASLEETADRARSAGLGVFFATITPFLPATGYDDARERIRSGVNEWMRGGGAGADIIDFDLAVRDEADPRRLASAYDSGDHLHPSAEGLERMAAEAADTIAARV